METARMKKRRLSKVEQQQPGSSNTELAGDQRLGRVRVLRYDPSTGREPFYEEFDGVPFQDRSVIAVLRYIYKNRDSSLSHRHECTRGFCRSCMLLVNGAPVLACQHPAGPEMTVEPHPKF